MAQNIDVVLNRRNCMAAALRIIEENIPEVRPLSAFEAGVGRVGSGGRCVSEWFVSRASSQLFPAHSFCP